MKTSIVTIANGGHSSGVIGFRKEMGVAFKATNCRSNNKWPDMQYDGGGREGD